MRRILIVIVVCIVLSFVVAASQTQRRSTHKRPGASATFAEKQQAEIRAGREEIATQIKALTQFLYLLGGISKSIETAEQVNRSHEQSSAGMSAEQIEQSKAKLKASLKSVRAGLDQLESSFRLNPVLQSYYPNLKGVAELGQTAENQAAANNFDPAGRSLITAVNKLADVLVSLQ